MSKEKLDHINEMYDIYRTTPIGVEISLILDALPNAFSSWVSGEHDYAHSWFFVKKKCLVQIIEVMNKQYDASYYEDDVCSVTDVLQ